jgi:uncharacterized membrane protein YphA (DoxX/SURF4 family)
MILSAHVFVPGLLLGVRLCIAGVMILAGATKISHPFEFLSTVYAYQILGPTSGLWLAMVLPWLELVVGFALLAGRLQAAAFCVALFLSLVFIGAQIHAMQAGLSIACGCFGSSSESSEGIGYLTIARTIGIGASALAGAVGTVFMQSARLHLLQPVQAQGAHGDIQVAPQSG